MTTIPTSEQPPSDLLFACMPYECEITAARTSEFEQAVDREIIRAAVDRKRPEGVDIYLARDGTCYGRVAQERTYVIQVDAERASLVANWIQRK